MSKKKKTITSSIEEKLDDVNKKLDSLISLLNTMSTNIAVFSKEFSLYANAFDSSLKTMAILMSAEAEADKQLSETLKSVAGISMPTSALPTKEATK